LNAGCTPRSKRWKRESQRMGCRSKRRL
jgi:hypothetical protein